MAPEISRPTQIEQPWLREFLETRGFERTAPASFTNGRATVRLEGNVLIATPGDSTKAWRTELKDAQPEAICYLLTHVLAAPSFQAQAELDLRATRQRTAEEALQNLATSIHDNPDIDGLPPHVQELLLDFERTNQGIALEPWGLDEFRPIFRKLSEGDLIPWMGAAPTNETKASLGFGELQVVLETLGQPRVSIRNTHQIHRAWVAVELVVLAITAISIGVWGLLVTPLFLMMGYMIFRSGTYQWWVCTGCGNCRKP